MENQDSTSERLARLEERISGAAKALELAQGSIAQAASLDKRVAVLEAQRNSDSGEKRGSSASWDKIIVVITLIIAGLALYFKR